MIIMIMIMNNPAEFWSFPCLIFMQSVAHFLLNFLHQAKTQNWQCDVIDEIIITKIIVFDIICYTD